MKEQTQKTENPLGTLPIPQLLVKYAVPSVISMLVMSLYNIVDQIFIGNSPAGYLGNGATTAAFPLITVMLALALLIGNGSAAYINIQMGKGNSQVAQRTLGNAFMLLIVISVLLGGAVIIFLEPVLLRMGTPANVMPYAKEYTSIICLGAPFSMVTTALTSVIRADGEPRFSMVASLSGAILNTILDPIFIFAFGMDVAGAAIATVISQVVSALLVFYYFVKKAKHTRLKAKYLMPDIKLVRVMAAYGSSSFITQIANTVVNVTMNNTLRHYGELSEFGPDIPFTAMGIVLKINGILISTILGVAIGAQPILGYNYGAGKYKRVRQTYLTCIAITVSLSALVSVLFFTTPQTFIAFFGGASQQFNEFASMALRVYLGAVVTAGFQIPSSSYFQAVGKPVKAMTLSMSRQLFLLVPAILIMARLFGVMGVLYAGPVADVLAAMISGYFILKEMRHLAKDMPDVQPGAAQSKAAI